MNTLVDFITHIKSMEYLIAIASIGAFIIFWELLQPEPFHGLRKALKEDITYIRQTGVRQVLKTMAKVVAAPFIGLAYVVMLPVGFFFAIAYTAIGGLLNLAGVSSTLGWRPMEAYFAGRRGKKEKKSEEDAEKKR
jgi:Na+/H+ antiporter NhaC